MPFAVFLALVLNSFISAGIHLIAKQALAELPPFSIIFWRHVLCSASFLLLLLFARDGKPSLPPRRAWATVLYLGFLAGPLNQLLFFRGLQSSLPAHGAFLYALTPAGVYGLLVARGTERPSARAFWGILLALAGVVVLLLGRGLTTNGMLVGDVWILIAVAAWVIYTADGKSFIEEHGAFRTTAWSMTAGALWLFVLAPWHSQEVATVVHASRGAWAGIIYLALLGSVTSYLLWFYALAKVDASRVVVFSNLPPVLTALLGWVFFHQPLTWEMGAGGGLVLAGVWVAQRVRVRAQVGAGEERGLAAQSLALPESPSS
jgi:drug/metabolite transporter (DMT)-like permease